MKRDLELWGAHACGVLVSAFCRNNLPEAHAVRSVTVLEVRDGLEAIASTPQACATRIPFTTRWK